jgi:hypothetical protein
LQLDDPLIRVNFLFTFTYLELRAECIDFMSAPHVQDIPEIEFWLAISPVMINDTGIFFNYLTRRISYYFHLPHDLVGLGRSMTLIYAYLIER